MRRRPGPIAVLAMGVVAVLAHGLPGVAGGEPPSRHWMDEQSTRARVQADARVTIQVGGPEDPDLEREARLEEQRAGRKHHGGAYTRDFRKVARRAASRHHIRHPELFVRQMAAESGYQPCARSGAGAIGIAQIMPSTARSWHVDPYTPERALDVAAEHMARYERQYGSYRLALAAYNAGPAAVKAYGMQVPPYPETREYVRRITDRSYPLRGMTQVFHMPGHMSPTFAANVRALQRDVRRHGGHLRIVEGWRSYDEEVRLWNLAKRKYGGWQGATASGMVAPPGCSNHGRGYAADLGGSARTIALAHRFASRHHLVFPMAREPWHIEPVGLPTQSR